MSFDRRFQWILPHSWVKATHSCSYYLKLHSRHAYHAAYVLLHRDISHLPTGWRQYIHRVRAALSKRVLNTRSLAPALGRLRDLRGARTAQHSCSEQARWLQGVVGAGRRATRPSAAHSKRAAAHDWFSEGRNACGTAHSLAHRRLWFCPAGLRPMPPDVMRLSQTRSCARFQC